MLPVTSLSTLFQAPNGWSIERLRNETPGTRRVVHLNNAGCALPCRKVSQAVSGFAKLEAVYGGYETVERCAAELRNPYTRLGTLLNCEPDEIAIVPSATSAWQQVVFGIDFRSGDRILTTPNEYGSNYVNFLQLRSRKGVEIRVIPELSDGGLDFEALEKMIKNKRPKLLNLTHVPTSSGAVYDAVQVGKIARRFDVPYLLDACQSVGQLRLDVKEIQCDFLSAASRKYLRGPRGIGFLYAAPQTRKSHEPAFLDVRSSVWESRTSYRVQSNATRYEQYEINFAAKAGFGVAVEYALDLGIDWIADRIAHLAKSFRQQLQEIPSVRLHDHAPDLCGIVSFTMDGFSAEEICDFLQERHINVSISKRQSTRLKLERRGVQSVIRASVHYYNTEEELDTCIDALRDIFSQKSSKDLS